MTSKFNDQISKDRYDVIQARYKQYLEALNDPSKDPVKVFDPLTKKQLDELELIREVSRELQNKKDEDMRKAAAAAQAEEEAKKAAEEAKNEKEETAEQEAGETVEPEKN